MGLAKTDTAAEKPAPAKEERAPSLVDDYRKQVERTQEIVRWTVKAFAAVGAALAGAVPVAALTGVDVASSTEIMFGGGLAFAGIALVIVSGAIGTTPSEINPSDLVDGSSTNWWRTEFDKSVQRNLAHMLPVGVGSIDALNQEILKTRESIRSDRRKLNRRLHSKQRRFLVYAIGEKEATLAAYRRSLTELMWRARFAKAGVWLRGALFGIALGAILTGLGAATMITNLADPSREKTAAEAAKIEAETLQLIESNSEGPDTIGLKPLAEIAKLEAEAAKTQAEAVNSVAAALTTLSALGVEVDADSLSLPNIVATYTVTTAGEELHPLDQQVLEACPGVAQVDLIVLRSDFVADSEWILSTIPGTPSCTVRTLIGVPPEGALG